MSSNNWKEVKLGDIVDIVGGGTPKTSVTKYWEPSEIDWITAKDVSNCQHRTIFFTERKISKIGLENSSARILEPLTTVLIARGATTGKVALISTPMAMNQTCYGLQAKQGIDELFIYYLMLSRYKSFRAIANGSTFDTVVGSGIKTISVKIPKYEHQVFIGEVLGTLDDKIELNQKIISNLEQLVQTIFKNWFIDFQFPNEVGETYKSNGGKMVESELGEIPEGWIVTKIDLLSSQVSKGTTPRKKDLELCEDIERVPFLKVRDISNNGEINFNILEKIPFSIHEKQLKRSKLVSQDILVSIAGTIGRVSHVPKGIEELNINQAVAFIRLNNLEYFNFVYSLIKNENFEDYLNKNIVQAVQANISLTVIKDYRLVLPTDTIISKWNEISNPIFEEIDNLRLKNENLVSLRESLLPKLLLDEMQIPDESVVE